MAAGALAAGDVISEDISATVDADTVFISAEIGWSTFGFTPGQGAITVGLAHGNYTSAEIEECLEQLASWDLGDLVAQEQRRRMVRVIGSFPNTAADEVLNDGLLTKTKLGWMVAIGETLQPFIWNSSGQTLTTGGSIVLTGGFHTRRYQ